MLTGMVIDALDVAHMERFWLDATGGLTGGLRLRFVPTVKPKQVPKNRLHLDLAAGPDWEAEVARLLALGATRTDIGQGDVPWDVLADPEGNELRRTPTSTVSLVMGPPAAPKAARNRLRLEVTQRDWETGEFSDAGGNEFHVTY